MSILPKLEQAMRAYLLSQVAVYSDLITHEGDLIVTDTGLLIRMRVSGRIDIEDVHLTFYVGETEEEIRRPAVTIVASSGVEDFGSGHFTCDIAVQVEYPGDSYADNPDVVAMLGQVSHAISTMLMAEDLATRLNGHGIEDFTSVGLVSRQGARAVDGRTRIHRYMLQIYCVEANVIDPP